MAHQFNKIIILNKSFGIRNTDQSSDEYPQSHRAHIVKLSENTTSSQSGKTFLLIPTVKANANPLNLRVLPIQQVSVYLSCGEKN